MRVLLADKLHPASVEAFAALPGAVVDNQPGLSAGDLPSQIADVEILVVRSTKVTAAAIAAANKLGLIIRAGSGYNTIDVESASAKGIYVANCPGKNAVAVAELALALMLSLERRIAENVQDLREGRWNKGLYSQAAGFKGKTVGIVGTGMIGQETIERLKPFGVKLLAWSRSLTPAVAEDLGVEQVDLLTLARCSDVVSLHLALSGATRGMIDQEFLDAMKPGATLINTCRAEVVDQAALLAAMDKRGLKLGTDVFENEPTGKDGVFDSPIARHRNCHGTHHIGASTDQAELETGMDAVRIAEAFTSGQSIPNCVNLRRTPQEGHAITIRHEDRVGVLAGVLGVLKEHGRNIQEMENTIFSGSKAACARISLDSPASASVVEALTICDGVLHVRSSSPNHAAAELARPNL